MRCQKCGFVSFDYLSQCKKCGADLTMIRQVLGFSESKSEVPSLLGALLKHEGKNDKAHGKPAPDADDSDTNAVGGLDWQEMQRPEQTAEQTPKTPEREVKAAGTPKDELVIELSEEDLEALAGIEEK